MRIEMLFEFFSLLFSLKIMINLKSVFTNLEVFDTIPELIKKSILNRLETDVRYAMQGPLSNKGEGAKPGCAIWLRGSQSCCFVSVNLL